MAVPKTKVSKSRRDMRNSMNFKAKTACITDCTQCHAPVQPHCVCRACGYYKGSKRIEVAADNQE